MQDLGQTWVIQTEPTGGACVVCTYHRNEDIATSKPENTESAVLEVRTARSEGPRGGGGGSVDAPHRDGVEQPLRELGQRVGPKAHGAKGRKAGG